MPQGAPLQRLRVGRAVRWLAHGECDQRHRHTQQRLEGTVRYLCKRPTKLAEHRRLRLTTRVQTTLLPLAVRTREPSVWAHGKRAIPRVRRSQARELWLRQNRSRQMPKTVGPKTIGSRPIAPSRQERGRLRQLLGPQTRRQR